MKISVWKNLKRGFACVAIIFCSCSVWAAEPPLSVYGRLPGFETAAISPSGNHIAILGRISNQRGLVVINDKSQTVATMDVGTAKIRSLDWAGDGAVLIRYTATVDLGSEFTAPKAELGAVYVLPLDGTRPWRVFDNEVSITGGVRGYYGVRQRDGRWFGYFSGITLDRGTGSGNYNLPIGRLLADLYEVDLQNRKIRMIAKASRVELVDRDWLMDPAGKVGATLDIDSSSGKWVLKNGAGDVLATGLDLLGRIWLVGFTPDGSNVIYASRDKDADQDKLFSVALAKDASAPQAFLKDVDFDTYFLDDENRLLGYRSDDEIHFFDARKEKIYKASQRAFPDVRMSLMDQSASFEQLIVETEGPGDPMTWWRVNIKTGKADILGTSYSIPSASVGPMRMESFTASDGLKMEGVLTLPPGREAKMLPAVVMPHGGPSAHDVVGFDWFAQAFASRGYVVFQPNFRGSTGYGNAFMAAGNGEWGRRMQTDISDGLAELVRKGIVDPKRVCIVGASYGGYAALAGVTLQQGIYRCAVSVSGVSNLTRMVQTDLRESLHDPMLRRSLTLMVGAGRNLKTVSPIQFAEKVAVPVMLIHGKDDTVVEYAQSKEMAEALAHAGKPVELVTLPGEDHWLSKSDTRQAMLEASVTFIAKHNPPDANTKSSP